MYFTGLFSKGSFGKKHAHCAFTIPICIQMTISGLVFAGTGCMMCMMCMMSDLYLVAKTYKMHYKLQVIFRKRATDYKSLLRKMTGRAAARRRPCRAPAGVRILWINSRKFSPVSCRPTLMACSSVIAVRLATAHPKQGILRLYATL